MNPLCTVLPPSKPSLTNWYERYLFNSAILSDWCHEDDLLDMHATFIEAGIPYTVQYVPPSVDCEPCEPNDWADECRSVESRNSSLRSL